MRRSAALLVILLAGCGPPDEAVTIRFQPVIAGAPVSCTMPAAGKTLTDLRFFVHDLALVTPDGRAVPVKIDPGPPWQSRDVALLDLENGEGSCDTGSPATHMAISAHAPAGRYTGLRFTLGVPFNLNHADPALAAPPLDETTMHWHWQAGYKFLRAGIRNGGNSAWMHLGSTGCKGHIGAITSCDQPNRVRVDLPVFDAAKDTVAVDVGALLTQTIPEDGTQSCQSEADNPACAPIMHHLGLANAPQDVFRAMAR